ncbi:MAG TPA: potassium transporter Kup [Verrucomicrobiales bacterium]|nr:potassium transporter Kup [Verrucomicrobiales bacterium]
MTTPPRASTRTLVLGAVGVVFGDIGTSPLYAVRECFHPAHQTAVTEANVLGVLSLIIWALIVIICVKYLAFVLRADNRGEGGELALLSLCQKALPKGGSGAFLVGVLGVFGASLLFGDGMITPSISVLSAVEGLREAADGLDRFVIPLTLAILIALFSFQFVGTERVGAFFGPVMLVWFLVLAILGLRGLAGNPEVLQAFFPWHGLRFLFTSGHSGFLVLGSVFLVVTGGEALYADMGHFGRRPIRLGWFVCVLPALLLNYLGQGALLLADPEAAAQPFYRLAPAWALIPLVALATLATVIASQALITGTFSVTLQAVQLGYFPRTAIRHTSHHRRGQIYVPLVNWILLACCLALVLGFRSSSGLANAYGLSVSLTMLITTSLLYVVARHAWGWSRWRAGALCGFLLTIEFAFFAANFVKVFHGGWVPLVVGLSVFTLMTTWSTGRKILGRRLAAQALPHEDLLAGLEVEPPLRVPGTAVFMTANRGSTPVALLHNLKHNKVLHERVLFLTAMTLDTPAAPESDRVELEALGKGFFRVTGRYGFMEEPDVPRLLELCADCGLQISAPQVTFFLGRETLVPARRGHGFARWRAHLFAFLSRIAQQPATFFRLPPGRVVELGIQIEI